MKKRQFFTLATTILASLVLIACGGGGGGGGGPTPAGPTPSQTFAAVSLAPLSAASQFSAAVAINDGGQAVGVSEDAGGNMKGAMWTIDQATQTASAPTMLAPLAGADTSAALGINGGGMAVGQSRQGVNTVPVMWAPGATSATGLATLAAGTSGAAYNANTNGMIVGELETAIGAVSHAVIWTSSAAAPVDMGSLAGNSAAYYISDQGVVVGESDDGAGASVAVFWTVDPASGAVTAGPTALAAPAGALGSIATGVSSGGVMVGEVEVSAGEIHAFRWDSTGTAFTDLGTLGSNSSAGAINTAGQIAGWNDGASGALVARFHAGDTNSDSLLDDVTTFSQAYDINNNNTVVGIFGSQGLAIVPR